MACRSGCTVVAGMTSSKALRLNHRTGRVVLNSNRYSPWSTVFGTGSAVAVAGRFLEEFLAIPEVLRHTMVVIHLGFAIKQNEISQMS